jgi:hypothetical protein
LWSGQAEAFSGGVMNALHSRRIRWRQSRKPRIHMRNAHIWPSEQASGSNS